MNEFTNQEIDFLIAVLEHKRPRYSRDVKIDEFKLHDVEIYQLQNKLEKLRN